MLIRFNNVFYNEWEKVDALCWHRTPLYKHAALNQIKLIAMIEFNIKTPLATPIWYPEFTGDLDFLQEIYDKSSDKMIFQRGQVKMAKDFIDKFLFKISRLKAFI